MHTPNRKIRPFSKIKIGDQIFNHEDEELVGTIKWKGSTNELRESEYEELVIEEDSDGENIHIPEDYDWVISEVPMYGDTLYNYDCDPSGVIIIEEDEEEIILSDYRLDRGFENTLDRIESDSEYYLVKVSNILQVQTPYIKLNGYDKVAITVAIFIKYEDALAFAEDLEVEDLFKDSSKPSYDKVYHVYLKNSKGITLYEKVNTITLDSFIKYS